jgi:dihydrofolate reductase
MRKIVAGLFLSLDGVTEAPEHWQLPYVNDELLEAVGSRMAESDTILLGRTYEEFAAYWPNQGSDVQVADHMNNTPKLVVSTTLDTVEWQGASLLNGDVAEEPTSLKQQPGKDISIIGSATRGAFGDGYLAFAGISAALMLVAAGVLTAVVRGMARRAGTAASAPYGA